MKDIISFGPLGLGLYDTQTQRAKNILSVQRGSLEYAPELGIDLKYFLSEEFEFQNESFRAYLVQVLAENSINISTVSTLVEDLLERYTFNILPSANDGSMISR